MYIIVSRMHTYKVKGPYMARKMLSCCSLTSIPFISISTLFSLPIFISPPPFPVTATPTDDVPLPDMVSCEQLPNENLSIAIGQNIAFPNRVLTDSGSFAQIIVGFPDAVVRVHQNTSKCICWCGLLESLLHVTTASYLART